MQMFRRIPANSQPIGMHGMSEFARAAEFMRKIGRVLDVFVDETIA
jgi:hypothetical protein